MVKMIALYKRPEDVEAFMDHYETVHIPIVRRFPGIIKVEYSRMFDLKGGDANPFMMAEMYFENRDTLMEALRSPAGRESGRDATDFAGPFIQVMFADVETEEP